MTDLLAMADERFVSLTTFRRDGTPVATPVWIGRDGDALVVTTPAGSGKVKRLRNNPRVEVRPCSRMGKVEAGAATATGHAAVLDDPAAHDQVAAVVRRKYSLEYFLVMGIERLTRRGNERVAVRITEP